MQAPYSGTPIAAAGVWTAAHVAGLIVSETIAGLPQQHRSASAMRGAAGLKSIPF